MSSSTPEPADDLLWRHLTGLPAFRALLRAVEARFYLSLSPLPEPVLDLGCGDGHFASVTFPHPLAAGVDPGATVLEEARARDAYRVLAQASGSGLPFPAGYFASVISNSVLEHIPDLDPVLAEVSRVLRPGGRFLFTVPGERFTQLLLFTQLFCRVGLKALARAYARFFNRISRHEHCDSAARWRERLQAHDLHVRQCTSYFSARAHHALDMGHYLGLPSLVAKKLTGRWILVPTHWNLAPTYCLLRPLASEPLPQAGAYLFFDVVRGGSRPPIP